jgi:hypothetical protein
MATRFAKSATRSCLGAFSCEESSIECRGALGTHLNFTAKRVVAPPWIADINWLDATVSVDLTRQAVKDAPPFDAKSPRSRAQEHSVFEHHGRPDHAKQIAESPFG